MMRRYEDRFVRFVFPQSRYPSTYCPYVVLGLKVAFIYAIPRTYTTPVVILILQLCWYMFRSPNNSRYCSSGLLLPSKGC